MADGSQRPPAEVDDAASPVHYALAFPQLQRSIDSRDGETLFESARRAGVRIVGACGGRGTCGSCVVRLLDGEVHHSDARAEESDASRRKWLRACLVNARSDCTLEIAPRSLAPVARAEADTGEQETLPLDPSVTAVEIDAAEATLDDPRADADRLLAVLGGRADRIGLAALRLLPAELRGHGWRSRVLLRNGEVIGFAAPGTPLLGLAVDLGTTNVAAFLVDLENGRVLARLGIENPQTAWGSDLISRLNHAITSEPAARELRQAAVTAVNALGHDLCQAVGAGTAQIVDLVLCGNTAMHHLLLGLPVRQLARAPFVAALRDGIDVPAHDLGIEAAPGAALHAVANVGGFVGGDLVATLLATEATWRDVPTALVLDIGTNTELALIHDGEILCASCPSGPALEGGHISCGMRAAEGAIERIGIAADGRLEIATIGNQKPVGLCGSGVLDAVATLLEAGLIGPRGRIVASHPDVHDSDGMRRVRLAPEVEFTQDDVRAVQLAKAAIRTGIELLLRSVGLDDRALGCIVIAGAFGAYIDVDSGVAIGLLPDLPRDRYSQVGNAAGVGVRRMVASRAARDAIEALAGHCRYVELSTRGDFQQSFMRNIGFDRTSPRQRDAQRLDAPTG